MFKNNRFNILIITSFFILLIVLFLGLYEYNKSVSNTRQLNQEAYEKYCKNDYEGTEREEFCKNVIEENKKETDFFTTFTNVVVFAGSTSGIGMRSISFIMILFVIVPVLYYACRYLKSNAITNLSTRNSHVKNVLNFFVKVYRPAIILPLIGVVAIIICYIYAPNLEYLSAVSSGSTSWTKSTLSRPYLFMFLYVTNLLIHGVLFVNIALIVARKYHNFFVALILSFLTYIAIEVVLEVVFGGIIISSILNKGSFMSMFNIMGMFTFNDYNGIFSCMIVPFVLMMLSFIIVLKLYRGKEKLIIDCERNVQEEAA